MVILFRTRGITYHEHSPCELLSLLLLLGISYSHVLHVLHGGVAAAMMTLDMRFATALFINVGSHCCKVVKWQPDQC